MAANWEDLGGVEPEDVLNRWVEEEADDGYPTNRHLTQKVLWRATKHVGCREATKS